MKRRGLPDAALRAEARRLYGADPAGYEAGRPDYPERIYELLATRCGVRKGTRVLEIGPGTGRVTRQLAALGAEVVVVEPDRTLAARLEGQSGGPPGEVICGSFEDAALPDSHFDVVVAAMSFHWVDQKVGLPKLRRVVCPGGWVALWWTVFGDPSRPDRFDESTRHLTKSLVSATLAENPGPFELDVARWRQDLEQRAGLIHVAAELVAWTARFDIERLRAFYGSMIAVRRLAESERERLLDGLADVASRMFGGTLERPFVTAVYTGRRP